MNALRFSVLCLLGAASPIRGAIPESEVARLGKDLTPLGHWEMGEQRPAARHDTYRVPTGVRVYAKETASHRVSFEFESGPQPARTTRLP